MLRTRKWSGIQKKIVEFLSQAPKTARTSYLGINFYEVKDMRSYYHAQKPDSIGWWCIGFEWFAQWPKDIPATRENFKFARRIAASIPYKVRRKSDEKGRDKTGRRRICKVHRHSAG